MSEETFLANLRTIQYLNIRKIHNRIRKGGSNSEGINCFEWPFFKEKAEHIVNTSAIANSIFTYFIS